MLNWAEADWHAVITAAKDGSAIAIVLITDFKGFTSSKQGCKGIGV